MANHRSALKRMRQSERRASLNKSRISRIKTFVKKFIASLGSGNESSSFSSVQSEIHRGVTKGVLHRNTADRKISRLSRLLKSAK
ncbi:MAG: 30S ribosomal protein S20 [Holosporaceae bacterium]|jgi:small subunit ribosomal protein S20|nr:30S ribosomal protein S20 [Holosporaceae bacterium]